ncbi:hypothetical protein V6R21_18970 [Limibacter armeniacum]|uniref:hypothetical protein n=1 Tax=Limibacter armeniacum TaxID=466084 RepID=UPI002FE5F096
MKFFDLKKYAIKKRFDEEIKKMPYGRFDSRKDIVLEKLQYEFFLSKRRLSDILFCEEILEPTENMKRMLSSSSLFSKDI